MDIKDAVRQWLQGCDESARLQRELSDCNASMTEARKSLAALKLHHPVSVPWQYKGRDSGTVVIRPQTDGDVTIEWIKDISQ